MIETGLVLNWEMLLTSVVLMLLLQGAKKVQSLNVWKGEKTKIRLVLGGLAVATTVIESGLNGTIADPQLLELGATAITQFLLTHFGYEGLKGLFK